MTKHVRFTLDLAAPPTLADGSGKVVYGILNGSTIQAGHSQHNLADVRLLPPCSPTKIVCVGRNYAEHAKEMGNAVPTEPLIFMKPPSSLNAHGGDVNYPAITTSVSYEGELGVIIGKRAWQVAKADWEQYVLGYTLVNDMTARDLQKKDGQWTRGKGFDTFCPTGPWMIKKEEVDLPSLRVMSFVDGEKRQDAPVTDMIFDIPTIIHYVTQFMTLEPGDLIATGTPPGVGIVEPGAMLRVEIPGIGVLENRLVKK
jgi:2-keto-4-pentenoate hydratase/2-oxohepta-3-ene-1,7-dioic acid hydratase in catechol pathway